MKRQSFTLAELATYTNSRLHGDPNHTICNVADLDSACASDASFLANPNYEQAMKKSKAGVIFIAPHTTLHDGKNFLIHDNPSQAFQMTLEAFHGNTNEFSGFTEIHSTAIIHPTSKIGKNVVIGPYAVIDKETTIGDHTFIGSGVYIGPYTNIGTDCTIHPRVTIREKCTIGNRVILQPGAVIGSCGFGYLTNKEGQHSKLNQVGTVLIEDDVEIGANTTIDRARFKETRIGKGTKLDNLVQIAHGVELGENNIFAAQTGIAGSTTTGKCVIAGGQVAIAGHLHIASGVRLAGRSGVSKSIEKPDTYSGAPVMQITEYNRNSVFLRNIETYIAEIKSLQKRIALLTPRQRAVGSERD